MPDNLDGVSHPEFRGSARVGAARWAAAILPPLVAGPEETVTRGGPPAAYPLLRAAHLTREVDGQIIVDDVSVDIPRGDVLAIVGPSGAGKSSFLRLLNRLDEPTHGSVFLEGVDYKTLPPRLLRCRVGLVAQAPMLFPGTVADNIRFGPTQRGREIAPRTVAEALEHVGLAGDEDRDVSTLSGGEAQRVALARTLINAPEVLLLDEPTSALDEVAKRQVEGLIVDLIHSVTLTCVIVTHDPPQAARIGRRVVLMERGRLVQIGTVEEVLHA